MNILELHDLSVGHSPSRPLIEKINCAVSERSVTLLLGPNGSGKSTLLRALSGFDKPLGGTIQIGGKHIGEFSRNDLARILSIVTTDALPPSPHLTVRQLVGLGRQPYSGIFGRLSSKDRQIVHEALELVGITDIASRNVSTLSDGERQKAMIARAIAQQPRLLLMDEPTGYLDVASRIDIMRLIQRMVETSHASLSIILSSHDVSSALSAATDLWLIDPKEHRLITGPKGALLQSPDMNIPFRDRGVVFNPSTLDYKQK